MGIRQTEFAEFLTRLGQCGKRADRTACLAHFADAFGVGVPQLRRLARDAGFDFGYQTRCDKGVVRDERMLAAAQTVATWIQAHANFEGRAPTYKAIDACRVSGLIPADCDLSVAYVDRYIRAHAIERKARSGPRAPRKVNWGPVGEILQIDSTNCQQWFFVEDDGAIRFNRRGQVYRNKPSRSKTIMRYVASDPTSDCFRVRYYLTDGESADVTLQFLHWAMSPAQDPTRLPMCGVPRAVVLDKGPGNSSSACLNACEAIGIDHRMHATGHSWAKGNVERDMQLWQEWFETDLVINPATSIEDLNARAELMNVRYCGERVHTRHHHTRSAFYAANCGSRVAPPAWAVWVEAAHTTPEERTISGSFISYEGREYWVGQLPGAEVGKKVMVTKAILDWDDETRPVRITLDTADAAHTVIEYAQVADSAGRYLDSRVYKQRVDASLDAKDAAPDEALARFRALPVPEVNVAAVPVMKAPPLRIVIQPAKSGATYRRPVALTRLCDQLGARELSEFEIAALAWGDAVTQAEIDTAVKRLSTPAGPMTGTAASA